MAHPPIPVLFTHYGDEWLRGSETLLLDLLGHLDKNRIEPIVWCNANAMAEASRKAGFPTYQSKFQYYFDYDSPAFSLRDYLAMVREGIGIVRKHNIRVLHSNSAAPTQWLALVGRMTRRPLLTHLHTNYLRRSRYVLLLHQAQLIVGVSRYVLSGFSQASNKTAVIYNGIDSNRLQYTNAAPNLRAQFGIPDDAIVISSIGALVNGKGNDLLIQAMKSVPFHAHLLIVGDGLERKKLESLAVETGVADRVHFVGYINPVAPVYRHSDIIALASRAEAFGLVLAEAGFCALPVVATTVGGIPEVIDHSVTGLLVPPDNVTALSAALARLVMEPDYRKKLGVAASERVARLFSV